MNIIDAMEKLADINSLQAEIAQTKAHLEDLYAELWRRRADAREAMIEALAQETEDNETL